MRRLLALLGVPMIRLYDFDGDIVVRRARIDGDKIFFVRFFSTGLSRAFDDGSTSKEYVDRWEWAWNSCPKNMRINTDSK